MKYDIARLRKTTIIKLVFMSISIALPIIAIMILTPLSSKYFSDYVKLPVKVLRYVVLGIGEAFILCKLIYYIRILTSEEFIKKDLIRKNDERLIFIRQKYSLFTIKMVAFLLLIGIIISGFLSTIVFITLSSVLIGVIITAFLTYIYYKNKY